MILDTCFIIDLMRETVKGQNGPAVQKMSSLENREVFISLFTLCELRAGAEMSSRPEAELEKIELLTEYTDVVYPDGSFPVLYGEAEAFLRKSGTPIPLMDLLIGVSAKAIGQPVLTKDADHFRRIPGIVVVEY